MKKITNFDLAGVFKENKEIFNLSTETENKIIVGVAGKGKMIRLFQYQTFHPEYAEGFVKFVSIDNKLVVKVIDTYGHHNEKEEAEYINKGYVLIGYESKLECVSEDNNCGCQPQSGKAKIHTTEKGSKNGEKTKLYKT